MECLPWVICCLLLKAYVSQGEPFHLRACSPAGSFFIVENQPTRITCSGLDPSSSLYWTIRFADGTVGKIGNCNSCDVCAHACKTSYFEQYEVTRTGSYSTLHFKNSLTRNDQAVVTCSSADNTTQSTCNIYVVKPCANKDLILTRRYTPVQCQRIHSSEQITWRIKYADNTTATIADCGACSGERCPACRPHMEGFKAVRKPAYSDLTIIANDGLNHGAILKCFVTKTAPLAVCRITVSYYSLPECINGVLELWEMQHEKKLVHCMGVHSTDIVYWRTTETNGNTFTLAFCNGNTQDYKCNSSSSSVTVSRNSTTSKLVIEKYIRQEWIHKTLVCIKADGAVNDSCPIRVIHPALPGQSIVTLHDNFTVTAVMEIDKVFDQYGLYTCQWQIVKGNTTTATEESQPIVSLFIGQGGQEFNRCTCTLEMTAAPSEEGQYFVFVEVIPGTGLLSVGHFTISKPGNLLLRKGSCPEYAREGLKLECHCRHSSTHRGSPPARVYWSSGSSDILTITNVTRKDNNSSYTCKSEWGPDMEKVKTKEYIIRVAYGPSNVSVTREDNATHPQHHVTFTCTADDVYPPPPLFSWDAACLTVEPHSHSSACVITQEALRGKPEVVCTVYNSKISELSSSASFQLPDPEETVSKTDPEETVSSTLDPEETASSTTDHEEMISCTTVSDPQDEQTNRTSNDLVTWIVVAVVTVVVICLIVVTIVCVRRRRASKKQPTAQSTGIPKPSERNEDDDFEEFINDIYEGAGNMTSPAEGATSPTQPTSPSVQQGAMATPPSKVKVTATKSVGPLGDVYAEVTKVKDAKDAGAKKENSSAEACSGAKGVTGRAVTNGKTNVDMSSAASKTKGVPETDDDYNTLQLSRKISPQEADPTYSHV